MSPDEKERVVVFGALAALGCALHYGLAVPAIKSWLLCVLVRPCRRSRPAWCIQMHVGAAPGPGAAASGPWARPVIASATRRHTVA